MAGWRRPARPTVPSSTLRRAAAFLALRFCRALPLLRTQRSGRGLSITKPLAGKVGMRDRLIARSCGGTS